MNDNFQMYVNIAITLIVSGFINYFISSWLSKKRKWFAFIVPSIILVISLSFLIVAIVTDDAGDGWIALGWIIFFIIGLIIFVGTMISSIVVFLKHKDK